MGIAFNQSVSPRPEINGFTYAVTDGALPTGVTLDPLTGILSGIPTAVGTFNFTVQALGDGGSCASAQPYSVIVAPQEALCRQFFDSLDTPDLPSSWTSVGSGSLGPWVTSPANPDPLMANAAYGPSAPAPGRSEMTTPLFVVSGGGAQMSFRNAFNFEDDRNDPFLAYDGMVLEISINGGPFQDILAAGGSFVTGGYNKTISSDFGSALSGRSAWGGLSGGTQAAPEYITTTVNMPLTANGQLVRVRWVVATDTAVTASGVAGAWIDTIIGVSCVATAAGVEVSGRVTTPDGRGLRNAAVSLTDASGVVRSVTTGSFGYYRFDNVEAGRTYIVTVNSRRYRFASRAVQVMDTLAEFNFVGLE